MGARQSRRSVDITTTPKKEGIPTEGGAVGEVGEKIEKLGMIEEADAKPTSNGVAPHTDSADDKEKDKDEATEKNQENEKQPEEAAADKEEAKTEQPASGDAASPAAEAPAETAAAEATTPTEAATPASPNQATSPDTKEAKKKDKSKKKWSFRSISFSRKDKSKPVREATPKNGDVAKEEPLTEGGEEAEAAAAATSTSEDKSAVSSPAEESKDEKKPAEEAAAVAVAAKPAEEAAAPAAPVSEELAKKEEPAQAEAAAPAPVADKKVEVSPGATSQPIAAPATSTPSSITERKTTEEIGLLITPPPPCSSSTVSATLPSSPPPTPIDPSSLQQAQQVAPTATALAEALKLPHETQQRKEAEEEAPKIQLVVPTEEGPAPVYVEEEQVCNVQARPAEVAASPPPPPPPFTEDPEITELEQNLHKSLSSQLERDFVALEDEEDAVPPPLPESPAPLETASKIASFAATTMQESISVILDDTIASLPEDALKEAVMLTPPEQEQNQQQQQQLDSLDFLPPPSPQQQQQQDNGDLGDEDTAVYPLPPQEPEQAIKGEKIVESAPETTTTVMATTRTTNDEEETTPASLPLQNGVHHDKEEEEEEELPADHVQSAPEPEAAAVVENNIAKTEVVVTENGVADDAPKSPPPSVPVEAPQIAPAITEDVASVTKAIEEIDISEKAVAAAVNETIESAGVNEIVADSVHQNNLNDE